MSRPRNLVLLVAVGAPLLLGGCAKQLQRIELNTEEIATAQARLERQQREMETILSRLDERDAAREEQVLQQRAEMEAQLRALDRAVRQMDARAQEQEELLRRISAALDLLARRPTSGSSTPTSSSSGSPPDTEDGADGSGESAAEVLAGSAGTDVYDTAFADYTSGRYDLAREGFAEVLQRFPQSEFAPDAAYWWAETLYAEGQHEQARSGFERVIQRWPDHEIVAPALLKLAYSLLELGEKDRALDVLERLEREHPDSDEALIAQHRRTALQDTP